MSRAIALLLLTGCDVVLGLEKVPAPPPCDPFDEDGDGFGNACDACPADSDDGADGDMDLVGDACDPDRTAAGDQLRFFDGFDSNANAWMITAGDWHLEGGAFVVATPSSSRVELPVAAMMPTVEAIIPTYTGDGTVSLFGASGLSELRCSVSMTAGAESLKMQAFLVNMEKPIPATTGPLRLVGGQHHDGTFYCRARHGDNFDIEVATAVAPKQAIDKIGLLTDQASATVTSITVYEVP